MHSAENLLWGVLDTRRRIFGNVSPITLESAASCGCLLLKQGRPAETGPLLEEAHQGYASLFGRAHPKCVTAINNMGVCLQRQGKLPEAEQALREAL